MRVTRLAETVFYATIVVDGPTGTREVDARPSDAVNLALVTGTPIRVDPELLDDPPVTEHPQWHTYPTGTSDLATEARQQFQMTCPSEEPRDQEDGR